MSKGFTVMEVVLAVFLASFVSLSLFQLLRVAGRGVRGINKTIEVDMPLSGFYDQVEKDVTGMFAPFSSIQKFAKKDFEAKKQKGFPFKQDEKEKPPEIKLDMQPIENVFELDVKGDQFYWSFITTGGLQVLEADGSITPTPFVRRVAYVLEPDPQRPEVQRLMYRFSGAKLDAPLKSSSFSPSYELISGIKTLAIELTLMQVEQKEAPKEDQEEGETKEAKPEAKATTRTVSLKEWKVDEIWDKYKTLIPAYVKLSGIRVDIFGAEYPFEVVCEVYAYSPYVEKEKTLFEALEDIASKIWK